MPPVVMLRIVGAFRQAVRSCVHGFRSYSPCGPRNDVNDCALSSLLRNRRIPYMFRQVGHRENADRPQAAARLLNHDQAVNALLVE